MALEITIDDQLLLSNELDKNGFPSAPSPSPPPPPPTAAGVVEAISKSKLQSRAQAISLRISMDAGWINHAWWRSQRRRRRTEALFREIYSGCGDLKRPRRSWELPTSWKFDLRQRINLSSRSVNELGRIGRLILDRTRSLSSSTDGGKRAAICRRTPSTREEGRLWAAERWWYGLGVTPAVEEEAGEEWEMGLGGVLRLGLYDRELSLVVRCFSLEIKERGRSIDMFSSNKVSICQLF